MVPTSKDAMVHVVAVTKPVVVRTVHVRRRGDSVIAVYPVASINARTPPDTSHVQQQLPLLLPPVQQQVLSPALSSIRPVQELTDLLQAFADGLSLECVSMKAVIILQALVLQKPSHTSKTRDNISHLKKRMELWKAANYINETLLEGRCIQECLPKSGKHQDEVALVKSFKI